MLVEFLTTESGQRVLVNVRPHSFSLTIDVSTVYNFDALGRLLGAYRDGRNYLRGLDNRVLVKWGAGHGLAKRARCDLNEPQKQEFFAQLVAHVQAIRAQMSAGQVTPVTGRGLVGLDEAGAALASVWTGEQLAGDGERFRSIYKPVSILPPDRYLSLVVQATEGCSWNKCTFCNLYRDRPFAIKPAPVFRQHVRDVLAFLGRGLNLRTSLFLADANALVIAQDKLLRLFDVLHEELLIAPAELRGERLARWAADHPGGLRGIYSFVDAFTIRRKSVDDYFQLAQRGLRRAYIGLESGDEGLLAFLDKGSLADDARQAVLSMKAGGVDVGVILMLGVGGRRFADAHVRQSTAIVNAMGLGSRDILYFSPFFDYAGSQYARRAAEMGVEPLDGAAMDAQMGALRAGLRFADPAGPPKIAIYDIREFIY